MGKTFTMTPDGYPPYTSVMESTVRVLKELGGKATNDEIEERIIKNEGLSAQEQSYLMPNKQYTRLYDSLGWARYYLKKGGALDSPARTVWELTESGFEINDSEDIQNIFEKAKQKAKEDASKKQKAKSANKVTNLATADDIHDDTTNPDDAWKPALLAILQGMDGYAFERLCQRLLRASGFIEVNTNAKKGADGGIDGIGFLRVNLISFKIYFQCKRWKDKVGPNEIRDFRGALEGRAGKGLFITTSSFTNLAKEESARDGAIAIDLINGYELCNLLKENNLGVDINADGTPIPNPDYFNSI